MTVELSKWDLVKILGVGVGVALGSRSWAADYAFVPDFFWHFGIATAGALLGAVSYKVVTQWLRFR